MIEVYPKLYVGNKFDYEDIRDQGGWFFIQCAKHPWHKEAVGYAKKCDPSDPEYLVAYRPGRIILNMVDAPKPEFFSMEMIQPALDAITATLHDGLKVLVHCNQGESRSAGVAMLWMHRQGLLPDYYDEAKAAFKELYPMKLGSGVDEFLRWVW
jgi:hypothetical protein